MLGRGGSALTSPIPSQRLLVATSSLTAALHPREPGLEFSQTENVDGNLRASGQGTRGTLEPFTDRESFTQGRRHGLEGASPDSGDSVF